MEGEIIYKKTKKYLAIIEIFLMILTIISFSNSITGFEIKKNLNENSECNKIISINQAIQENNAKWNTIKNIDDLKLDKSKQYFLGAKQDYNNQDIGEIINLNYDLPDEFDWRNIDEVDWTTLVKNQKSCGSCVAFGVLGALESVLQINSNNLYTPDLSEANLFFCGGASCGMGWMPTEALKRLKEKGVPEEACFPYQPIDMSCKEGCNNWQKKVVKIDKYGNVPQQSIKEYLITKGPLIATFVVYEDFRYYSNGVYEHVWGPKLGLHCVTMVGYDDNDNCWICKNSWGTDWGDNGWFKIKYRKCEIDLGVKYLELAENNQPNIPNLLNGISTGIVGQECSFTTLSSDPDYDGLYFLVDWDDGNIQRTSNAYPNQETAVLTHTWNDVMDSKDFNIKVKTIDVYGAESQWTDTTKITIYNNKPDKPIEITGKKTVTTNKEYEYTTQTIDPDNHQLFYLFNWGDGTATDWIGPINSGENIKIKHIWEKIGRYQIKVKAKDIHGAESEWSNPTSIAVPKNFVINKNQNIQNIFIKFFKIIGNLDLKLNY